jgi:hypothetical protein
MRSRCRAALLLLACTLAVLSPLFLFSAGPRAQPAVNGPPRLIVLVYFDQMRGDYLTRWQGLYGRGGFRRLCTDGAWFTNCHYPYANTVTAAGHASVATGCSPAEHGIVGNQWFDRASGEKVGAAFAGRYTRVPPEPYPPVRIAATGEIEKTNVSPELLCAPTIGDAVKKATEGKGRVVSLSIKERAAALPAGQHPDACYWFDTNTGAFVTSTYYRDRAHPWVADFNRARPADAWFGWSWKRFSPGLVYDDYAGPDDVAGEGGGRDQGTTFPHPMRGGLKRPGPKYYLDLCNKPYGNDLLLDLALRAIDAEQLGRGAEVDFLSLSFSCNDMIGHIWGPDSQEVLDVTLRSDVLMEKLLNHLDAQVGRGRYVLALTADHGVCPLPEVSRSKGIAAGRLFPSTLEKEAGAYLDEKFGKQDAPNRWFDGRSEMWFFLNHRLLRQSGLAPTEVENALASWLKQQPGILAAYTRSQLLAGLSSEAPFGEAVQKSFYPERCGDVGFVLKPYYVLHLALANGTNHGMPHFYDTHVPLLIYGANVRPGIRKEPITPQAAASILTAALHIDPPEKAQAAVPIGLFSYPVH